MFPGANAALSSVIHAATNGRRASATVGPSTGSLQEHKRWSVAMHHGPYRTHSWIVGSSMLPTGFARMPSVHIQHGISEAP